MHASYVKKIVMKSDYNMAADTSIGLLVELSAKMLSAFSYSTVNEPDLICV